MLLQYPQQQCGVFVSEKKSKSTTTKFELQNFSRTTAKRGEKEKGRREGEKGGRGKGEKRREGEEKGERRETKEKVCYIYFIIIDYLLQIQNYRENPVTIVGNCLAKTVSAHCGLTESIPSKMRVSNFGREEARCKMASVPNFSQRERSITYEY